MNAKHDGGANTPKSRPPAFWRHSLYEEPTWVSLAWVIGPALAAGTAIYFVLR